jgi:hypothetical protein
MKEPRRFRYDEAHAAYVLRKRNEDEKQPVWAIRLLCDDTGLSAQQVAQVCPSASLPALASTPTLLSPLSWPPLQTRWTGCFSRRKHFVRARNGFRPESTFTGLGLALEVGNDAAVRQLLEAGGAHVLEQACVKRGRDQHTYSPLGVCVEKGWFRILELTLATEKRPDAVWGYPCFIHALAAHSALGLAVSMIAGVGVRCSGMELRLEVLRMLLRHALWDPASAPTVWSSPCISRVGFLDGGRRMGLRMSEKQWTPIEFAAVCGSLAAMRVMVEEFGCPMMKIDRMRQLSPPEVIWWLQEKNCRAAVLAASVVLRCRSGFPRDLTAWLLQTYAWSTRAESVWAF